MKVLSVNLVQEFKKNFLTSVLININCCVLYVVLPFYQERIKGTEKASPIHTLFHR